MSYTRPRAGSTLRDQLTAARPPHGSDDGSHLSSLPHRRDHLREVDAPRDPRPGRGKPALLRAGALGISPRTLSLRLRALEEHGIVERHTYPEVPPRVEYALTEKGRALVPLIEDMRKYGRRWLFGAPQSGDGRSRAAVTV